MDDQTKAGIVRRLHSTEWHVRGIQRMVEEDKYCSTNPEVIMSQTVTLNIPAISCHHCTMTIARETKQLPGVLKVEGNPQAKTATFTVENEAVLTNVKKTLVEIGYPAAN